MKKVSRWSGRAVVERERALFFNRDGKHVGRLVSWKLFPVVEGFVSLAKSSLLLIVQSWILVNVKWKVSASSKASTGCTRVSNINSKTCQRTFKRTTGHFIWSSYIRLFVLTSRPMVRFHRLGWIYKRSLNGFAEIYDFVTKTNSQILTTSFEAVTVPVVGCVSA